MANESGGVPGWVWGCGIGCFGVLMLGLILAYVAYRAGVTMLDQAQEEIAADISTQYGDWKEDDRVPEEHAALFDSVVGAGTSEEATFAMTMAAGMLVFPILDDDEVSEAELDALRIFDDYATANPSAGMMDVLRFVDENPELQTYLEGLEDQSQGSMPWLTGGETEPAPAEEPEAIEEPPVSEEPAATP